MSRTIGIGLLERERRTKGWSTAYLAKRMGVSHSALSQAESGLQVPSPAFRKKAARALGVPVARLWPQLYFLADSGTDGIRLRAVAGRVVAFTSEARALKAATDQIGRVCGPAPPGFFALAYGITEAEAPERLLIDPASDELAKLANGHNSDGAAPHRSNAVKTSKAGKGARPHGPE